MFAPAETAADAGATSGPWRGGRGYVLAAIDAFLETHQLAVDRFTLAVAHDYVTGADGLLCRQIDKRVEAGGLVDRDWLCAARADSDNGDPERAAQRLLRRLESNIDSFSDAATSARDAARDYGCALNAQVDQLNMPRDPATVLGEIAALARAMVDRTSELERDMSRSEVQTRALRHSLDDARRLAEQDQLTGLPNRRAFEGHFAAEVTAARAAGEPLCVALCDVDRFKRINDTHGHDAGDRVLRSVASNLARIANAQCHVARHGGEEFVVLIRGRTIAEVWEILDDLRQAQAERRLVNREDDRPIGKVTFSGGVASVFDYADPRQALRAADAALYRAKADGRNRIIVAKPDDTAPSKAARAA